MKKKQLLNWTHMDIANRVNQCLLLAQIVQSNSHYQCHILNQISLVSLFHSKCLNILNTHHLIQALCNHKFLRLCNSLYSKLPSSKCHTHRCSRFHIVSVNDNKSVQNTYRNKCHLYINSQCTKLVVTICKQGHKLTQFISNFHQFSNMPNQVLSLLKKTINFLIKKCH